MTYHIITVFNTGARLSCDRGFLVCQYPDRESNRIALADVRGIIIANPAVSFSNESLARLLAQDSIILHCDRHFKPIGWTVPLERVIRREVFGNQILQDLGHSRLLWQSVCRQKMLNQAAVLDDFGIEHSLYRLIDKPLVSEANVSRQYWGHYFKSIGHKQKRERKGAESFENKALNYGYAVINTLVHRAILIHGLLPSLGIHHEYRYRSYPLVYDLMEPFRAFIDLFLAKWCASRKVVPNTDDDFRDWVQYLMQALRHCRVKHPEDKHSHKLMDAVDIQVRSVATCFENRFFNIKDTSSLWLPKLIHHYWQELSVDISDIEEDDETNIAV